MGEIKWVDYLFRKYDNSETSIYVGYRLLPTRIIGDNSLWPSDINRREESVRSARSNSSESGRRVTRGNERRKKEKSRCSPVFAIKLYRGRSSRDQDPPLARGQIRIRSHENR